MTLDLFGDAESGPSRWFVDLEQPDRARRIDGLVLVESYDRTARPPEEVATMEKARSYGAHSVFFEAGRNGRAPVPQAFVFVSKDGTDDEAFADLHKRLWSWGGVPIVYRRTPGQIQLFRCAHDPDFISAAGEQVCRPFKFLDIASRIATEEAWWNGDDHLVQMPHIVLAGLLAVKATCIVWAELLCPTADRFVGSDNAALHQHFLDKTQAQRKPKVEPDRVCDDLRWEAMALVAEGQAVHASASIPGAPHKPLP
jgi:hypothetical protein